MVRTSCTSGIAEDEDALGVIHECRRFGEVRRGGTTFNDEAPTRADDTAGAAGYFGDHVCPKSLDDLVERAGHRRKRRELLDKAVAACNGLTALDRLGITIDWTGTKVALRVGEWLVELNREGMGEIIEHIFARGDIDLDVAPVLGRD